MKNFLKTTLGALVVSTLLFSCAPDEPNVPTSNFFKTGNNYYEVSNGYIIYYGGNNYDIYITDGTIDESFNTTDVTKYIYFWFNSTSNDDLETGNYEYDETFAEETFYTSEFLTDDNESTGTPHNPFQKKKKSAFVQGGYYYDAIGGNATVLNLGGNKYSIDFEVPCKEYNQDYEETGVTETFTGNFEGYFTYIDNRTVDLYVQFIDYQTGEVVDLVDENYNYNFDNSIVQLYTNETDYYASTNGISYDYLTNSYLANDGNTYPDICEFYGLESGINYYFDALFESTSNNGFYYTSGLFAETLELGENLYGFYIEWYYNNGVKKMRIKSIEKLNSATAFKK